MDGESGPLKMWQIWALYDIAADFYADPENQAAFEAWQKQREKCKKTKRPCRRDSTGKASSSRSQRRRTSRYAFRLS